MLQLLVRYRFAPLVKGINPHPRVGVHYLRFNLQFAEIYHGRFDLSLHLTTLLLARLVSDRPCPTPQLIRDKKRSKVFLRAAQGSIHQTPMVIAHPLENGLRIRSYNKPSVLVSHRSSVR
jgi:hypothetical protein